MPKLTFEYESPYSIKQLAQLVMDVESYPEFIPWCSAVRVVEFQEEVKLADMMVSFKSFIETYRSRVEVVHNDTECIEISVQAVEGPFKYLQNNWRFIKQAKCTKVYFMVDFSFKSSILNIMINSTLKNATGRIVSAFEQRADTLFG